MEKHLTVAYQPPAVLQILHYQLPLHHPLAQPAVKQHVFPPVFPRRADVSPSPAVLGSSSPLTSPRRSAFVGRQLPSRLMTTVTSLSPVTTVSSGLTTVAGRLEAIVEDLVLRPAGVAITKDGLLAVSDELSRTVRFFHNNRCEVSLARRQGCSTAGYLYWCLICT